MTGPDTTEEDEGALADAGLLSPGSQPEAAGTISPGGRKVALTHRLYNGEAGLDVVGRSKLIYKITAVVMALCLLSMIFRGFNFGIDFAGGNAFKVPGHSQQLTAVRSAAEHAGAAVSSAQVVGGNTILLRTGQLTQQQTFNVKDAIAHVAGVPSTQVSEDAVSAA